MIRSILVPLDGSPFGEQALPLALSIARRAGASLQLVHVHAPLAAVYTEAAVSAGALETELKAHEQSYLAGVVQRLGRISSVPVMPVFLDGDVAAMIVAQAAGVDLVVMCTHGRGTLGRLWLGSVADQLIRELTLPLLLVRPGDSPPAWEPEPVLKHLLLPLDGSLLAERILEPAVALGTLMEADYTLLRVIRPVLPSGYPLEGTTFDNTVQAMFEQIQKAHEQLRQEAQDYLDGVAKRLRARSLKVQTRIALEEQVAAAILHEARPPARDLVALETHGRRGLPRLVLGSVADKLIRGSPLPVLVQRPPEE